MPMARLVSAGPTPEILAADLISTDSEAVDDPGRTAWVENSRVRHRHSPDRKIDRDGATQIEPFVSHQKLMP